MSLKLDPVDLMIYADVAEAFEGWIINNPEIKDESTGIRQSRVFAKTYLNLYITFLQMLRYVPKEEMEYESTTEEGVKRKFAAIDDIYVNLKASTELSDEDKAHMDLIKSKIKPTLH